jgi:hypothetical protein
MHAHTDNGMGNQNTFEVVAAFSMKIQVFWDTVPSQFLNSYQLSEEPAAYIFTFEYLHTGIKRLENGTAVASDLSYLFREPDG